MNNMFGLEMDQLAKIKVIGVSTFSEAVDKLNKETSFSKKDIYNASLNIKKIIG